MRRLAVALVVLLALGLAAWHWQSQLIGAGTRWWLGRIAARDTEAGPGVVEGRRNVVLQMNRMLLMAPPPDALVPELYDVAQTLSSGVATGEVSLSWAAWIYSTYQQDMLRDRPTGQPARAPEAVTAEIARLKAYYAIQKRPDVQGVTVGDVLGTGDDVITLDEIEESDRSGKSIDLRTRGAE